MKILVITNYYPPHFFGGYELKCHQIATKLRDRGHEVFVLAGEHLSQGSGIDETDPHVSRSLRYDTPDCPFVARLKIEIFNHRQTAKWIQDYKPDVIYLWNQRGLTLGPSQAACDSGIATIYQIGDFWPTTYYKPGRMAKVRRALRTLVPIGVRTTPKFSPAIVVGKWMAIEMKQTFSSTVVHHVAHGVELPPPPGVDHLTAAVPKFLYAGRIDPEKGLDIAIRAFALLHEQGHAGDFEFNILGGGEEAYIATCQNLINASGLAHHIHFLGKTNRMDHYYSTHSVLLMPTLMREPFGLVIIEAMSHAMIPVVSDAFGPREIVRHGEDGLRFPAADVTQLAANIRLLIGDPALRLKLGMAARTAVEQRFHIDREVSHIEELLLGLTVNSPPTGGFPA